MKLELHTERLLLTPLATTDLDLALELWTDAELVKYVYDVVAEEEIRQEMPDSTGCEWCQKSRHRRYIYRL